MQRDEIIGTRGKANKKYDKHDCEVHESGLLVQAAGKPRHEGEGHRLLHHCASGPSRASCVARLDDVCKMSACSMNMQVCIPVHNRAKAPATLALSRDALGFGERMAMVGIAVSHLGIFWDVF